MKDRLNKILMSEGIAATKFAEIIGVQRSSISHMLSGRNKPSFDVIQSILIKFPKLNPDWLLLGDGEMYREPFQATLFSDPILYKDLTENNDTKKSKQKPQEFKSEVRASKNQIFEKKVERVIVFFSDKTFSEYKPE